MVEQRHWKKLIVKKLASTHGSNRYYGYRNNIYEQNEKTLEQLGDLNIFFINIINDLKAIPMPMVESTHIDMIKTSWTK